MDNQISFRAKSPKQKKILRQAANKHYLKSWSFYMRSWLAVIISLIEDGNSPELLLAHIDKLKEFCKNLREK